MTNDILTLAAIVAAIVGVFKTLGMNVKYSPVAALAVAALFELIPGDWQTKLITICVVGLSAAGVYHYTQNSNSSPIINNVPIILVDPPVPIDDKKPALKRVYTHIADHPDGKDFIYQPSIKTIPIKASVKDHFPPVFDQGQLGSCTANGIVSVMMYYLIAMGLPPVMLSRLWLYYKERELEGTIGQDAGAMIRDGMKVLQSVGCAPEADFPYDITKFAENPSAQADADAAKFKIYSYHRVMRLKDLKSAIASGQPIVFGFTVYDSFEGQTVADTGIVPMPDTNKEKVLGGHCVVAVAYDDTTQLVTVRNSWGEGWGDKGYCYMPYALFDSPVVTDMWAGKYNSPKTLTDVSFQDAINHYVLVGTFNSPDYWLEAQTRFANGQITKQDADNFELAIQKAAARDITLGEL